MGEQDLGKPRASACKEKLAELNEYVPVRILDGPLPTTREALAPYKVVVLSGQSLADQLVINNVTHGLNNCFISADTFGLFASVFCDFGTGFAVSDPTGEPPVQGIIGGITYDTEGIVTMAEETRHGLETGDFITFHEVRGMTELNECPAIPVKVLGPYTFSIGDTSKMGPWQGGGVFEQVKQTRTFDFKSLQQSLANPEILISDFAKIDRQNQLHAGMQALHKFREQHNGFPRPRNSLDATELVALTKQILIDEVVDEKLISELSFQAQGALSPMTTFIGGFVAQEVLKVPIHLT